MSKYIPGNQKHLTIEDRIYIQNELDKGTSFKDIARFLCKDPTTISKEVKARKSSDWFHKGTFLNAKNFCTTSTMDAVKRSIIVRLPTNIPTMPGSLIGNTGSVSRIPGPESL